MPALYLLATADGRRASAWERQLPAGARSVRWGGEDWPASLPPSLPAVLVLDADLARAMGPVTAALPTVWVGEGAPRHGEVKWAMSEADSLERLGPVLILLDELVEKRAIAELAAARWSRRAPPEPAPQAASGEAAALWELFESAWEHQDRQELLLHEFRRASRLLLRAGEVTFFLRESGGFRAEGAALHVPAGDPLVRRLEESPAVLAHDDLELWGEPAVELAARGRLAQWGVHLVAPLSDRGRLLGWIALGPRWDGKSYAEGDRLRAGALGRLLGRGLRATALPPRGGEHGRLLREVGLTLAHELGNALVSLAGLRQWQEGSPAPELLDAARRDIARLEALNRDLGLLQDVDGTPPEPVDLRDLVTGVAQALELPVQTGPEPVRLVVARPMIDFALRALAATASSIQLRSALVGGASVALLTLHGGQQRLAGIVPEPESSGVPNQGRLAVFLAREIIRLHGGDIHPGPGSAGDEILITLRSRN